MDSQSGMGFEAAEKGSTTIVHGRIELRPRRSAKAVSLGKKSKVRVNCGQENGRRPDQYALHRSRGGKPDALRFLILRNVKSTNAKITISPVKPY